MIDNISESSEIAQLMSSYIARIRPPENIRHQVDVAYKIEGQSVYILELRPHYDFSSDEFRIDTSREKMEIPVAKTTYVKAHNHWKIFWHRSDNKWHSYGEKPIVKSLKGFLKVIDEDKYGCFWG